MSAHTPTHRVKVTIDVSEEERTYIKMLAAKKRMTISEFIMSYVRPNIPHDAPNIETQQAMDDIENKKNLTHCASVKEFWSLVGIDPHA